MLRRTLLRWLPGLGAYPLFRLHAQSTFPGESSETLRALAKTVLPSEIDSAKIADDFAAWVRNYRPGAEMDHGYGNTRLRNKPPSPAAAYLTQLAALREPLASPDPDTRREAIEAALEAARITDIPRTPVGQHVAADLMAFYFHSSDANDLCYRAAIGRDLCRGLAGSENPPAPLKGSR